jgi:hypothetical protein
MEINFASKRTLYSKVKSVKQHFSESTATIWRPMTAALGVISTATDEAWNEARIARGWEPQEIKDP